MAEVSAPLKSLKDEVQAKKPVQKEVKDNKIDPNATYEFELIVKPLSETSNHVIGNECTIFDAKEGRLKVLRYFPTATSIYKEDQIINGKDLFEGRSAPHVAFQGGKKRVKGSDPRLVEFFRFHEDNEANPSRLSKTPALWREKSIEAEQKQIATDYDKEFKAMQYIQDSSLEELLPIARVVFQITETDELTVKNRLRKVASHNSDLILANINNPVLKRQAVIQSGIDKGYLVVDTGSRTLQWKDTKAIICDVSNTTNSKKQLEQITEYTYQDEGQKFFNLLVSKLG